MEKLQFRRNDLCVESTPTGDKLYLFNKIEGDTAYFLETNIFGELKHVTFPLEGLESRFYKVIHNDVAQQEEQSNDTPAKRTLCSSRKKAKKISELKKGDKFYLWIYNSCSGPYIYEYTLIADPYYEKDCYRYREGSTLLPVFENGFEKTYEAYAKHNDKEYSWDRRIKWVVATSLEKLVKVAKSKYKEDISELKIKSYGGVNRSK